MDQPAPVLFLDIDDVLCLSRPYGGFDVIHAVNGRHMMPALVYAHVFTDGARAALAQVDALLAGRLRYVISSTWRQSFSRAQMASIFRETGLPFVAERLEEGERWCTPFLGGGDRAGEIHEWLQRHHRGEAYAVVDDSFSGWSLREAVERGVAAFADRVVVCEEGVGLLDTHVAPLVDMLRRPGADRGEGVSDV